MNCLALALALQATTAGGAITVRSDCGLGLSVIRNSRGEFSERIDVRVKPTRLPIIFYAGVEAIRSEREETIIPAQSGAPQRAQLFSITRLVDRKHYAPYVATGLRFRIGDRWSIEPQFIALPDRRAAVSLNFKL